MESEFACSKKSPDSAGNSSLSRSTVAAWCNFADVTLSIRYQKAWVAFTESPG